MAAREPGRARTMLDEMGLHDARALSYDEMLADDTIDAVYVTLPNHLHASWTIRCLEAGKHVLCEKPLTGLPEEAEAIRETAARAGRIATEGFMYMHHPQTDALVRLATAPDSPLGTLRRVHSAFCVHQTHEPTIRTRMSHACHGGCIMDLGCYSLSFVGLLDGHDGMTIGDVQMTLGEPLEGEAHAVDDDMVVRGTVLGAEFLAECSFRDPRGVHVTLEGEHATARTGWPWAPDHERAEIALTGADGAPMDPIVIERGGEKFQLQFEAFARAVSEGAVNLPDMDFSVRQSSLIDRIRSAGGLGVFVRVP